MRALNNGRHKEAPEVKGVYSRLMVCIISLAAAVSCNEFNPGTVTSPAPASQPPAPPPSIPPTFPTLTGVYDVTMTVLFFDRGVEGDLTGYRYSAVLTLVSGAGSFTELQRLNAAGENVGAPSSGSVTVAAVQNRTVLLVGPEMVLIPESITEPSEGETASPRVAGRFGAVWDISGSFVATRRTR